MHDAPPVQVGQRARQLLGGALHGRAARRLVRDVRQGIDRRSGDPFRDEKHPAVAQPADVADPDHARVRQRLQARELGDRRAARAAPAANTFATQAAPSVVSTTPYASPLAPCPSASPGRVPRRQQRCVNYIGRRHTSILRQSQEK